MFVRTCVSDLLNIITMCHPKLATKCFVTGAGDGTFPKSVKFTHPSGKEPVESVYEGGGPFKKTYMVNDWLNLLSVTFKAG